MGNMMAKFLDSSNVGSVRKTEDGYLIAVSKSARTGIQTYLASEIGDAALSRGFKPNDMVRVLRPESEVFSKDAMRSLVHAPVTIGHPSVPVTSENWKDLAVGEVGSDVMRDGDSLVVSLIFKDAAGIDKVSTTHKELSWGYSANLRDAPEDSDHDFEMFDFTYNHISAVPRGRAGSEYRVGDEAVERGAMPINLDDRKEPEMDLVKLMVGDKAVQVAATDADVITGLVKDHKVELDAKDEVIGELKAKLADAEAKFLDEDAIAALVAARVELNTKRDAVKAKFGDEAIEGASDAEIAGMFKVLDKAVAPSKAAKVIAQGVTDAAPDAEQLIADAISNRFNKGAK